MPINVLDKFKVCIDGALPLLSAMCDKVGLKDRIDAQIESDQSNRIVSTGTDIKALVMNVVAKRKALYKLNEFYKQTDTEKLFNEGIQSCNLTDDVMARALDELYEIGPKNIMIETAMASINEYNIPVTSIHADTTSKNVYGAYENSSEKDEAVHIIKGHSKDYRPDLKQIVFGLGTTKDRVIVIGDVTDGNTSDKNWNNDILKELRKSMTKYGLSDFIYVADSAAVTEETLKRLDGNKYRFIVCHSNQLEKRKEKTLNNKIDKEKESLLKAIDEFHKIDFYCVKDADTALEKFEKDLDLKYHELVYKAKPLERKIKRTKPGRPKKDEPVQFETVYKANIRLFNVGSEIWVFKHWLKS